MVFWTTIATGVAASFVAALVFLAFLHCIRPRIAVGQHIACYTDSAGKLRYEAKIWNKSRRALLDIYPRLQIVHVTHPSGGHSLMTIEEIELNHKHFFIIAPYSKKDNDARYAVRFSTMVDLGAKWNDREHSYIRFIIKATDRWSGVSDVFETHYRGNDAIKSGRFRTGASSEIV